MLEIEPRDLVVKPNGKEPPPPPTTATFRKGEYMPFFGNRCFTSAAWIKARNDRIRVAMLKLWWHAWAHETPAGSLPNDAVFLSSVVAFDYAEFHVFCDELLRGFVLCSDGRLHHRYLVEVITEMQTKRAKKSAEMREFRAGEVRSKPQPRKQADVGDKRKETKTKEYKNSPLRESGGRPEPELIPRSEPQGSNLQLCVQVYNDAAARVGWPQVQRLSDPRKAALRARLAECGGPDGWAAAIAKAEASAFLTGKTGRGNGHANWTAGFDWLTNPSNFTKLMEGNYDDRGNQQGSDGRQGNGRGSATEAALEGLLAADLGNRRGAGPGG